jgi:ATP synthase B/B' CF(0)
MNLNATLVVELVVFLIVLAVMARLVVKPLQAAMQRRQAEIEETALKEKRVEELLAKTQIEYDQTLASARREARHIIETGRRMGDYLEVHPGPPQINASADANPPADPAPDLVADLCEVGATLTLCAGLANDELNEKIGDAEARLDRAISRLQHVGSVS